MKKIILSLTAMFVLTACPSEEEVMDMTEGLSSKKSEAVKVIDSNDWKTESLLTAQNYFFDFSEKVILMKEESKAKENIKLLIKEKGVAKFCSDFIVPIGTWQKLESYCKNGESYKCSPEMKEYQNTLNQFLELANIKNQFNKESACL